MYKVNRYPSMLNIVNVFEWQINIPRYRLKVRVPLTLLDSPAMFYCRYVNIYAIRNEAESFNSSFRKSDDNYL